MERLQEFEESQGKKYIFRNSTVYRFNLVIQSKSQRRRARQNSILQNNSICCENSYKPFTHHNVDQARCPSSVAHELNTDRNAELPLRRTLNKRELEKKKGERKISFVFIQYQQTVTHFIKIHETLLLNFFFTNIQFKFSSDKRNTQKRFFNNPQKP